MVFLGASEHFTPDQALAETLNFVRHGTGLADVLIAGYDSDGAFYMASSHLSRECALWLAMELVDYVRHVGRHAPEG